MAVAEFPNFTLTNQQGDEVDFYKALDNTAKGMIIFVYPKANTPGCTKQACGFRDHYDEIKGRGYDVVGMSRDKQAAQASWKKSKNLPYDLLCDEDGEVLKELGCSSGNSATRSVFVVDKESRALVLERVKISPEDSVAAALKAVYGETAVSESDEASDEGNHQEAVETKVTKPSAKPKAKAKAKAAAGRPPMEKKPVEEDGKKVPVTKRATAKRSASVEAPVTEKKKATAAGGRGTGKKASVKRSEPSGGVDDVDDSPKGTKRARKAAATSEEDGSVTAAPAAAGGRSTRSRTTSQPAAAGRPRANSKPSTSEKATTPKGSKSESRKSEKDQKVKSGKTAGVAAAAPSKRAKK